MLGVGKKEWLGVWTAEGSGFIKVFVKTCPHVSTSCEKQKKNLPYLFG